MRYFGTKDRTKTVSFKEAVFQSLPPSGGLYFPAYILPLGLSEDDYLNLPKDEIAFKVSRHFVGNEIPDDELFDIVKETIDFPIPLVSVEEHISALELFHGPTWAFKDFGARFLSRCMGYFNRQEKREITILVATSGDTGGAVAAGFFNVPGINVKILYPKGKVSDIQQKQLTTWGGNISAIEIDGVFDDCQKLVKDAFHDHDINERLNLSSANSINVARLIPQSFYYFFALQDLGVLENIVVSVPSGNFGNLTGGLFAWKMGLPISRFIAATNLNHSIPDFLDTGSYEPKSTVQTFANAMDVGNPSNFVRTLEVFDYNHTEMVKQLNGFWMDDHQILETISSCYKHSNYLLDPHGAIGFQSLKEQLRPEERGIFLETAHPIKFQDVLQKAVGELPDFDAMDSSLKEKQSNFTSMEASFDDFKALLLA